MVHFSARIRARWNSGAPLVTWAIIVTCSVVWLLEVGLQAFDPTAYATVVGAGMFVPITALVNPWTWFTSLFLHAPSVLHVLFNMLALWSVGPVLEKMMGHWRFAVLYLISGLGGSVGLMVYSAVTGQWIISAYGASAALFGLFAAILVVFRRIGADIRSMLIWMAINFAMPLVVSNIAWQAHVGGFITGGALTWLLVSGVPVLRKHSFTLRMWVYGSLVVAVLLVVATVSMATAFVV